MAYSKVCKICGCDFIGTGPAAMYCAEHKEQMRLELLEKNRLRVAKRRAETGQIKKPGVGKGGNPYYTTEHPCYKHGLYVAERQRKELKISRRFCEEYGEDLLNATHYYWVVHHIDHNHANHDYSNLMLLCKRCHQIEHECHKAFTKGATTIP